MQRAHLIERGERVLDAAGELGLVRNLPGLEALKEVVEQGRKVLGKFEGNVGEALALACKQSVTDLLKGHDERHRGVVERLLKRAHALKDMSRPVGDHEAGEEDANVDPVRLEGLGRRAVAKGAKVMNALKAGLGDVDDLLLAKKSHQRLEGDALDVLDGRAEGLHLADEILGGELEALDLR